MGPGVLRGGSWSFLKAKNIEDPPPLGPTPYQKHNIHIINLLQIEDPPPGPTPENVRTQGGESWHKNEDPPFDNFYIRTQGGGS